MNSQVNLYIKLIFSILIFGSSLYILPFYRFGDQYHYRFFYEYVGYLDNIEWVVFWSKYSISTIEPLYISLSWVFSKVGISKDIYIAFFNGIIVYILISIMQLKKFNTHFIIIIIITFFNFYFLVLMFSAERLKFGIFFILLYILYSSKKYSSLFLLLAILSHTQLLIAYLSYSFKEFILKYENINVLLVVLVLCLIGILLGEHIYDKVKWYISFDNNISILYKSFIFMLMAIYYSTNKKEVVLIFIPLLIAIYLLSGDRLNMFAYFIFLYYGLQVNRGINVGIIITSIYLSYKSIFFLSKIILEGNGF